MNSQQEALQSSLHLSEYEVRAYLAALEFEHASMTEISEAAHLSRTASYPPIRALLKRGLLSKVVVGKRTKYRAVDPQSLLALHDRERLVLSGAIKDLKHSIVVPSKGMSVRYFPGMKGLEQAADVFLETSETRLWKTVENSEFMVSRAGEALFEDYIKRRAQKKIFSRTIIPAEPAGAWVKRMVADDDKHMRKTILVSPKTYPIESSFAVCGTTVMLLNAHGVPSGTLITNAEIARTFESMHDMIWDRFT